jgi:hypothetical protein
MSMTDRFGTADEVAVNRVDWGGTLTAVIQLAG